MLSLTASWAAHAVLDQVAPETVPVYTSRMCIPNHPISSCLANTLRAACDLYYQINMAGGYIVENPAPVFTGIIGGYGQLQYTYSCLYNFYYMHNVSSVPYQAYHQDGGLAIVDVTPPLCRAATPAYKFNAVSGMCERDVTEQCLPPNATDPATGKCEPPESYTITLTPARPTTEPATALGFTIKVENQDKQAPKSPVTVRLALKVGATSGGHPHGGSDRPRGGLNDATCTSDAPCVDVSTSAQNTSKSDFVFHPTDVSGTHTITPSCDHCSGSPVDVDVKVKEADAAGWDSLDASPSDYQLIGGEEGKSHHDNHYLTESAQKNLLAIVRRYNKEYPAGPVLYLNDASLEWGGKFDISGKWVGAHAEHRRGKQIDIRANQEPTAISFWRFADFKSIAADNGASASVHCSFPKEYSWACWFDMRENRHFHVRLTGK